MPTSLFTTVQYSPSVQQKVTSQIQRLHFFLPPRTSTFAVFEQRGTSAKDVGRQPHVHIVAMGVDEALYRRLIRRLFGALSGDVVTQRLNSWRTADIVHRYLQGRKKDIAKGEVETSERWRKMIDVPPFIDVNGARRRAARGVTPEELAGIAG
jgi:hypothetical protein